MAGRTDPRSGGSACKRAREWCSLRVDGELSDLEGRLLENHLSGCDACARFHAHVSAVTSLIREAPVEVPSRSVVPPARREVEFPARRRFVAAAVAAAMALGSLLGSLQGPSARAPEPAPELSLLTPDVAQLRDLPRVPPALPAAPSGPPNLPTRAI